MSLIGGWVPIGLQILALAVLAVGIGRRSRQWAMRWLPVALLAGVVLAVVVRLFITYQGWSEQPASPATTLWIALTGVAIAMVIPAWRGSAWWRRVVSVLAVPLAIICALSALNMSLGYFPTVQSAWQRVTGSQPPQWIDEAALAAMQQNKDRPTRGTLVWVKTPHDASGFIHRQELVYLPPAWFSSDPPPKLPAVMAIGAEWGHSSDWAQAGGAVEVLDDFAALHHGYTPVVVFPDVTGRFNNDTECVNGLRGNAADHLTKDVIPYMVSHFGVSTNPAQWGVFGWSSGGTCALTLTVSHPELFSAFVSFDGQLGPNAGTKQQTIARLFGGDAEAWAAFDPKTIVEKHGRYSNTSAWLAVSEDTPTNYYPAGDTPPAADALGDWNAYSDDHAANANTLCPLLSGHHIECSVVSYPGTHDFQSAGVGFGAALPWLAGKLGTPDAAQQPMPGAPRS